MLGSDITWIGDHTNDHKAGCCYIEGVPASCGLGRRRRRHREKFYHLLLDISQNASRDLHKKHTTQRVRLHMRFCVYESVYDSLYYFLYKVVCNLIFDQIILKCVNKWL
jgi:hypothetical protein